MGDNKRGVIGMAPGAKIMPLKVLDAGGYGDPADVAEAIRYAVAHGAGIINLSLGGSSDLLGRLFNNVDPANSTILEAEAAGVLVVAATGLSPAQIREAMIATAVNPQQVGFLGAGIIQADAALDSPQR